MEKVISSYEFGTIVALENIRDPGNLGTILRTMDGVGAGNCIFIKRMY